MGANHVRLHEGIRPLDRAIDVRLGREVHHGGDLMLAEQRLDQPL
jgi:hypothetical protein